jgi:hypothetical protein
LIKRSGGLAMTHQPNIGHAGTAITTRHIAGDVLTQAVIDT